MAGRIPKHFIEDLLARSDIAQVIGRRIPLKKAGKELKACCPFHGEKTPSFTVNTQKGFYHCFGCGAHGNALSFLMEYEHLDFVEAVETLAGEQGISVPREILTEQEQTKQAQQQAKAKEGYALLTFASDWFKQNLRQHPHKQLAIDYLLQRGVNGSIARDYGLGFAPNDKHALQRSLPETSCEQWQDIGLTTLTEQRECIDRFRGRIQFPIRDLKGRVVGFGGRIIQPNDQVAKYLNSPETDFFHKGQLVYGLYELLKFNRQIPFILVVEGYMDVIALAQQGIRHAVATLGTATTEAQIGLMLRYSNRLLFAYDGDRAGRQAAWKVVPLLLAQLQPDQTAQFFFLPAKEDPDSWVRRVGRDAFLQQLDEQSISIAQWLVAGLSENHLLDWQKADDSRRLLQLSLPFLQSCTQPALQYQLLQALANAAQLQEWQIEKLLGIKTGLAVHRKPSSHKPPTTLPIAPTTNTISQHLLALLSHFPRLTCPLDTEAQNWLKQHPHKGSQALWQQLHHPTNLTDNTHETPHLLSFEQATLEWNAGWQQWLCQALKPIRTQLLQQLANNGLSASEQQQLSRTQELLKQCKQS